MKIVQMIVLSLLVAAVSSSQAQEKIIFPVSASSKTLGYSPLWVALRQGFFDKQGLEVQLVLMSGADKAMLGGEKQAFAGSLYESYGTIDALALR